MALKPTYDELERSCKALKKKTARAHQAVAKLRESEEKYKVMFENANDLIVYIDIEGNFVETYVGGNNRKVAHPSQQVEGYHDYLIGFVEVFSENELDLSGCSYCPNYRKNIGEGLFNPTYKSILEK